MDYFSNDFEVSLIFERSNIYSKVWFCCDRNEKNNFTFSETVVAQSWIMLSAKDVHFMLFESLNWAHMKIWDVEECEYWKLVWSKNCEHFETLIQFSSNRIFKRTCIKDVLTYVSIRVI